MTHFKESIENIMTGIGFSFCLLWKNERGLYRYLFLSALISTMNSFLMILFPKYLLDCLTERHFRLVLIVIGAFCFCQFIISFSNSWIDKNKSICSDRNRLRLKTLLVDKLASLRLEQLEDPEKLRQYEFAQKCIDKGNAEVYVQGFLSIVSSAVVMSGVVYILKDLPWWVMFLILLVVLVNAAGNIMSAKHSYSEMSEETPTESICTHMMIYRDT